MLPAKYFSSTKPLFALVKFSGNHKTASKMRLCLVTLGFGDITGCKIVVSVCVKFLESTCTWVMFYMHCYTTGYWRLKCMYMS